MNGEGDLNEPVLWWADIFMLDAAFGVVERRLDKEDDGGDKPKGFRWKRKGLDRAE